ncbi:hypothetical protein PHLCEN_2v2389 [Hermanssonia centrifuga]|uniref:Uncharacterized protein n=1 Tax=Hermanssonia centrifuga TaxID=98765 RepID=A0A2R6RLZ6_9APHY|nr:hypothetical protein PHLCEN_2v2389 [Hermanssonia centrifuga]
MLWNHECLKNRAYIWTVTDLKRFDLAKSERVDQAVQSAIHLGPAASKALHPLDDQTLELMREITESSIA